MAKAIGLGFAGAHRVGKSELAHIVSNATGLKLAKTSTVAVFARHGIKPSDPMDFDTRLAIQHEVLADACKLWDSSGTAFVSDRTPLCAAAYTLADIQGSTVADAAAVAAYVDACLEACARYFTDIVVIPPAIPLVAAEGKAALSPAYINHLHYLVRGLAVSAAAPLRVYHLPRECTDREQRLAQVRRLIPGL